jgi:hypothetical protein
MRAFGVWGYVSREHDVKLIHSAEWNWHNVVMCDAVFLHRPWTEAHAMIAELCGMTKTPLWVDYDDDLFSLTRYNPAYHTFMTPKVHSIIRRVCEMASVITVSVDALRMTFGKEANVVPNAFNDYIWKLEASQPNKIISWRGGSSHLGDVAPYLPAISTVSQDLVDWTWHFFGEPHWEVDRAIPNDQLVRHFWLDPFRYLWEFKQLKPAINIVPLLDNKFNRCKSNLAWIEATYAGAVTIAPAWEEWEKPGVMTYSSIKEFGEVIRSAVEIGQTQRSIMVDESRRYIEDNLLLSKVNDRRLAILEQVTGKGVAAV